MSKLVKFEDGTYGIRVWWFFVWFYRDLRYPSCTWSRGSEFFKDCQGTKEEAMNHRSAKDKHKVVEDN